MIRELITQGYKDQTRHFKLTGLDMITADSENGVGKSAVLEALQLAIFGEIPGQACSLEEILRFTTSGKIIVEARVEIREGTLVVKRTFLYDEGRDPKCEIEIDGISRNYSEGHRWVKRRLGAVFPTIPFHTRARYQSKINKSWFIEFVLPNECPGKIEVRFKVAVWLCERFWGTSLLEKTLNDHSAQFAKEKPTSQRLQTLGFLTDVLIQNLCEWDPEFGKRVKKIWGDAFALWLHSHSSLENILRIGQLLDKKAQTLKSETFKLDAALDCLRDKEHPELIKALKKERVRVQSQWR